MALLNLQASENHSLKPLYMRFYKNKLPIIIVSLAYLQENFETRPS